MVILWGATSWDKNRPLTDGNLTKIDINTNCPLYPCYGKPEMWHCQNHCMDTITVNQVKEAINEQG